MQNASAECSLGLRPGRRWLWVDAVGAARHQWYRPTEELGGRRILIWVPSPLQAQTQASWLGRVVAWGGVRLSQ